MFYSTNGKFEYNDKLIEGFSENKTCGFKSKEDIPYGINIGRENIVNWSFNHYFSIKKVKIDYSSKDYLRVEYRKKIIDGKDQTPTIKRYELNLKIPDVKVYTIAVGGGSGGGDINHTKDKQGTGGGGGGVVFGNLSFTNNKTYIVLPGNGGPFNGNIVGQDTEIYDSIFPEIPQVKAGGGGIDGIVYGGTCFVQETLKEGDFLKNDTALITNDTQSGFRDTDRKFNGQNKSESLECENFSNVNNNFDGIICKFDGEYYSGGGKPGITNYNLNRNGDYCWDDNDCSQKLRKNYGRGGVGRGCSKFTDINKGVDGVVIFYIDFDNILLSGQSLKIENKDDILLDKIKNVPEELKKWIPNEIKNRLFINNNYFEDVKEKIITSKNNIKNVKFDDILGGFTSKTGRLDLTDINIVNNDKTSQYVVSGWEAFGKTVYVYPNTYEQDESGKFPIVATKGNHYIGLSREDNSEYPTIVTETEGYKKSNWPYTLLLSCRKDPLCSSNEVDNKLKIEIIFQGTNPIKTKTFIFTVPDDDKWIIKPFSFESLSNKYTIKISNITDYDKSWGCMNVPQIYIDNVEIVRENLILPSSLKSIDCKGKWETCDTDCTKKWKMEQYAEGPNGKCSKVENQIELCKPGEGKCPLDNDCKGEWGECDRDCLRKWRMTNKSTGKGICNFVNGMQEKCYKNSPNGLCNKYDQSNVINSVCEENVSIEFYIMLLFIGLVIGFLINFVIFDIKINNSK
jgi:hypothetical protein